MEIAIGIVIGIVALFHVYVMWLEMFAWTTKGPKTFKNFEKDLFPKTKTLAANQGLYNGFLAAGLIWSFFISNPETRFHVSIFCLVCIVIAGIYGALTADKKIFFVQALPALIGITLMLFSIEKGDLTTNIATSGAVSQEPSAINRNYDIYLVNSKGRALSEVFPISANNKADFSDSLFFSTRFTDELGKSNELKFYGPSRYAIGSQDAFKVTLNNWGVIYSETPIIDNYVLIKSKDEGLNGIISLALVNILKYKKQVVEKILQSQDQRPKTIVL